MAENREENQGDIELMTSEMENTSMVYIHSKERRQWRELVQLSMASDPQQGGWKKKVIKSV